MNAEKEPAIQTDQELNYASKRLSRINQVMQKYIDRGDIPGSITLVMQKGQVIHREAQGFMDIASRKPMSEDCIFRMYSMTKPVTAVAILMLYEEGSLTLDDPVCNYIPAFASPMVIVAQPPRGKARYWPPGRVFTEPAQRDITIRDLLTHTAGLASPRLTPIHFVGALSDAMKGSLFFPHDDGTASPRISIRDTVEKLARIPLSFQPSTCWQYGHEYDVLGVLIETISGKTLEAFFQEKIFGPLNMRETSFILKKERINRLVTAYAWDESWNLKVYDHPRDSIKVVGPKDVFSGLGDYGGILSTASDYLQFARMLLNKGEIDGVRLLSPKTVNLMTSNHTGDLFIYARGFGWGYGFSLGVRTELTESISIGSVGTYGWGGAACTQFFVDPKEELIALALSQVFGFGFKPGFRLDQEFEKAVYQALI
jgi:CubicO group peptidase (beta-lactamase class C family)